MSRSAIIAPTSQVRACVMMIMLTVGSENVRVSGRLPRHNVHTRFHGNQLSGSRVGTCGQIDTHDQLYMCSFREHRVKRA
jgi:hypothetical protein